MRSGSQFRTKVPSGDVRPLSRLPLGNVEATEGFTLARPIHSPPLTLPANMSLIRRFASTTAPLANALSTAAASAAASSSAAAAAAASTPRVVSLTDLPPPLARHIHKHLARSPDARVIPNPFLTARDSREVASPVDTLDTLRDTSGGTSTSTSTVIRPRSISRRREKQLRAWYPDAYIPGLPPSSDYASTPVRIAVDGNGVGVGVEVQWEGGGAVEVRDNGPRDLYAARKTRFKGHKHERERPERERETRERLAGMEKRIGDWKKVSAAAVVVVIVVVVE